MPNKAKTSNVHLNKRDVLRYAVNIISVGAIIYLAVSFILKQIYGIIFDAFSHGATVASPTGVPEILVAVCNLILVVVGLDLAIRFSKRFLSPYFSVKLIFTDPKDERLWLFLPVYLGLGIITSIMTAGIRTLLADNTAYVIAEQTRLPENVFALIIAFIAICIAPAILEEIFCRGIMQRVLSHWGVWFSIVVSSVLFTLLHGDIAAMPSIFIMSVFLGLAAYATNSLLPCVILHMCNNIVSFILMCVQQKLTSTAAMGAYIYVIVVLFGVMLVCLAFVWHWKILKTLKPIPIWHNPQNRQSRILRLATSPIYIVLMVLLTVKALWPLFASSGV